MKFCDITYTTSDFKNQIYISQVVHRGEKRIKLEFAFDIELTEKIKKVTGARWSSTMCCWHLPYSEISKRELSAIAKESGINILQRESAGVEACSNERYCKTDKIPRDIHKKHIDSFVRWLKGQRYSGKTIETYIDALMVFFRFNKEKSIETMNNKDVENFNYEYILRNNYSTSYQNQVISAIKLFFKVVADKVIVEEEIERPRREHKLPDILSGAEVESLLKSTINMKHKSMLSLIYACGLRRGELLNLRLNSIDSKRKLLIIKGAKGNKDRMVPLPESLIDMLREYYKAYKPVYWLFEGARARGKYTETSIQHVFKQAVKRAGIKKEVTLHTLRHSYATHLLENGTDLRFIQELLGHKSSRTTEIYTHVTEKSIARIKSPFDNLKL